MVLRLDLELEDRKFNIGFIFIFESVCVDCELAKGQSQTHILKEKSNHFGRAKGKFACAFHFS